MDILIEREMDIIIEKRNGYSHEKWMLSLKENDAWLLLEALSIIWGEKEDKVTEEMIFTYV